MRQTLLSSCFAQMRQLRQLGESQVRELEGFEPRQCGTEPKPLYGTVFSLYLLITCMILTFWQLEWTHEFKTVGEYWCLWSLLSFKYWISFANFTSTKDGLGYWLKTRVNGKQTQTKQLQKNPQKNLKKPPKPWLGSIPGSGTSSCVI